MASEGHCCHSHTAQSDSIPALGRKLKIVVTLFLMAGVATDYTEIGLLWSNHR